MTSLDQVISRAAEVVTYDQTFKPVRDTVYLGGFDFNDDEALRKLLRQSYETQWSVDDLSWERPYDPDEVVPLSDVHPRVPPFHPGNRWSAEEWQRYEIAKLRYFISQTLHAEQLGVCAGGVLATSGPTWSMKSFGGWLTVDESRHAETLYRYTERIGGAYPMNGQMNSLVSEVHTVKEWDKVFLLGHVLVEGVSLGSLGHLLQSYSDPLLFEIVRLIQRDEARHVAFGATQLSALLDGLSSAELLERQQLLAHCTKLAMDKLIPVGVAEEFGIDVRQFARAIRMSPAQHTLDKRLYSHVASLCQRLGLLDANNGWLRREIELMGLIGS